MVSEPDTRRCASEDAGLRKGVDREIPHPLERGTSANKDVGPQKGWWIVRSHIHWREERVPTKRLAPEGVVDCEVPH